MDGMGQFWIIVCAAGVVIATLLMALLIQLLRYQGMFEVLARQSNAVAQQRRFNQQLQQDYREKCSALRAEKAHVAQLERKVLLLQAALADYMAGRGLSF
jgi:Tfp pilus assembly protein PilO